VTWEERLFAVFDDLEQQAEGLALLARDADASARARDRYAEVDLASRLHASVGSLVELVVPGAGAVAGRLLRVANGWCLVEPAAAAGQEVIVNLAGLLSARGLVPRAAPEPVRGVAARLGIASALRAVAAEQQEVVLVRADGEVRRGRLGRVGADFVELIGEAGTTEVVPMAALSVIGRR
jgi:hypothetical protein